MVTLVCTGPGGFSLAVKAGETANPGFQELGTYCFDATAYPGHAFYVDEVAVPQKVTPGGPRWMWTPVRSPQS